MKFDLVRCITLAALWAPFVAAQRPDSTTLKQVIIFGRHGARTPVATPAQLTGFSVLPFPTFSVPGQDVLTPNGKTNETLLGGYFRQWLTREGLLTGYDNSDARFVYARAENVPLIMDTAQAFVAGLLPGASVTVNTVPVPDPLFDAIDAGVAPLDGTMAVASVNGRLGGNPQSLSTAYAAEFAMARSVLFNYPLGTSPPPGTPKGKVDVTALPITVTVGNGTGPVNPGGLQYYYMAVDPFMMEYADGMPEVGWGNLNAASISQIFRVYDELLDLEYRTPYLAQLQSSNLGSHIVRSIFQAASGTPMSGALGTPSDKIVSIVAANTNLAGLAGLFRLDWLVPGDQPDVAALGGAIVFERRQSQRTGEYLVRVVYITQTMDQLRNRTPLTLAAPPANIPVFIPGCSVANATFDCPLGTFMQTASQDIDPSYVDFNH